MGGDGHFLAHLATLASSGEFAQLTMETDYGLIIELGPGKPIVAKLRDDVVISQEPSNKLGFKYRIFTDWETEYLWYQFDWPGNPSEKGGDNLSPEELMQEQGGDVRDTAFGAWVKSWEKWYDIYDKGFEENLNGPGDFNAKPIPDPKDHEAWAIQGMLLAVWLSLLPSVASISYDSGVRRVLFNAKAEGEESIGSVIATVLSDTY